MKQGIFISLEGDDGAGKTTAARNIKNELEKMGLEVVYTREPGGSPIAEQIRQILLDPANKAMDAKTEAVLYAASRNQHVKDTILPALQEGKIVLCDRFLDSSIAYQGYGRKLGADRIEHLNDFVLEGLRPDLTLFFEVSDETGHKRMVSRGDMNRLDQESRQFHEDVRQGFRKIKSNPANTERIHVVNAEGSVEEVLEQSMKIICEYIKSKKDFDHE